jgi:hypothetical protein
MRSMKLVTDHFEKKQLMVSLTGSSAVTKSNISHGRKKKSVILMMTIHIEKKQSMGSMVRSSMAMNAYTSHWPKKKRSKS